MAKAYVTRIYDLHEIWEFDVKEIDTDFVVFNDGSRRLCHTPYQDEQFWMTREEAEGAIGFARKVMRLRLQKISENLGIYEDESMNQHVKVEKKN